MFAGCNACGNGGDGFGLAGQRDGALGGKRLRIHHVDKRAERPALDRGGRHGNGVFEGIDPQADIDELSGPQSQLRIGKACLDADRAGGLVHLIVDHLDKAAVNDGQIVGFAGLDCHRSTP